MSYLVKKKTKVKEEYTLIAPKVFGEKELGVTFASKPEEVIGRELTLSVLELVDDSNKYYLKFSFKVDRIEGKRAFTKFHGSECLQDYISRMVVRRVRRLDTIQDLLTKDNVKLRVKTICTLPRKAKSTVERSIRRKIEEIMSEEVGKRSLDDFVKSLLSDEIKKRVLEEGKKIYPIRNFEIRKVEVLSK